MKIKSIQKGEDIYYEVVPNSSASTHIDSIDQVLVDKEIITDNKGYCTNYIKHYEYHGFKDGKLVFTMTNDNLFVEYES